LKFLVFFFFISIYSTQSQNTIRDSILYRHAIGGATGIYTNFNYKFFVHEDIALELSAGNFRASKKGFYQSFTLINHTKTKSDRMYRYFGAGFISEFGSKLRNIGLRVPLGFEIVAKNEVLTIYGEVSPMIFHQVEPNNFFSVLIDKELNTVININFGVRLVFIK